MFQNQAVLNDSALSWIQGIATDIAIVDGWTRTPANLAIVLRLCQGIATEITMMDHSALS